MARSSLRGLGGFAAGFAALLLACELLLRLLPVSTSTATGYHLDPLVLSYPPGHEWTSSTGWDLHNAQRLRANNAGFVAERDFVPDPHAVALIGDSYVEAAMLNAADRPGVQLERALAGRPVFALGSPGSALLDYAERIHLAHVRYGVRDVVVLMERADVRESLCGSGHVQGPCLDRQSLAPRTETQPPPSAVKQVLRHSALAQYVFGQLKFDPARLLRQATGSSRADTAADVGDGAVDRLLMAEPAAQRARKLDAVTAQFFERIRADVPGRLVIVIDADRAALYRGEQPLDADRSRFIAQARAAGATVVDAEPLYRAEWQRSGLRLDVGPYDGHLNALGVGIVMQAAAQALAAAR